MKKKFKIYLLLLFFIALTLNIPSVMAKQYTEGWIRRTGLDAEGNQVQIVDLEDIFTYDKNGKKIEKLLIDCSGLKEAGFGYGNGGYTNSTDKINYGLCKIAEYDTNLPTVSDTMAHTLQEGVSKTTIEIIDANGNHYDEYYETGIKNVPADCDAILTAETKNTKGYQCTTLSFGHDGKTLPLGKYTIRKTYIYTGGSTNTPVTKTIEGTIEIVEYQSSDIEGKGFILEAYDSGTNKLIKNYPVFYLYELYKNVDDTEPITDCYNYNRKCYTYMDGCPYEEANTTCSPTHQVSPVENNELNAKPINPALLGVTIHNAKKICLRAMVNDNNITVNEDGTIEGTGSTTSREKQTWFCLKYVDEFGSDYRFEILDSNSDGRNANANRVKAIGKKKIQDYSESYEQYKKLGGIVSTLSYSTFQISIPYTGNGSNDGGNSGTDSGNQGNNTSSNTGTINIEFSNIKDSVKELEYKLCTTKDCSEQVIFSSTDIEASISNLEFDKKYYLVISKVPSNYAMPQDNVKEITLTKDNTSFSAVFKLSEKANVPNTLANRPMIIVLISILALAGGSYLIYRSMKSQKLN